MIFFSLLKLIISKGIKILHKGINMALHPNFVDNNLRIKRFYIVELENIDITIGKFDITFSKYATIDKNVIMWENIKQDDESYKSLIMDDFKSIITPDFKWKFNPIQK